HQRRTKRLTMQYHPLPQPDELDVREREDAMGAYFMMFATAALGLPLPILNLVAAIIYYFVNRSKGRFVQFHTLQSLYSQIPVTLLNLGLVVWIITNLVKEYAFSEVFWGYVVMVAVANLVYLIFSIVGAVQARKGYFYYFLFFGKLAYAQVYRVREEKDAGSRVNQPPKI
ncbi:MAG: DUF4870 domain-containing protein, partial [Bacteroidales bacterium]|nr:DUF4870 domain-containing protein [Bacteroidales bacterium]